MYTGCTEKDRDFLAHTHILSLKKHSMLYDDGFYVCLFRGDFVVLKYDDERRKLHFSHWQMWKCSAIDLCTHTYIRMVRTRASAYAYLLPFSLSFRTMWWPKCTSIKLNSLCNNWQIVLFTKTIKAKANYCQNRCHIQ